MIGGSRLRNLEMRGAHLTESNLPTAVGDLLRLNNYEIEYNINVHGSQIDVVASSLTDPFAPPLYIEVTIEYVTTEKYGKDTTKFLLIKHKNPSSTCLCVSSRGFTAFVKERAKESGIIALSYSELFEKFEKFSPYVSTVLSDVSLLKLMDSYEEPLFSDSKGTEYATEWLGKWKINPPGGARWLIVLGEYGTGKTSLTRVLQCRWAQEYLESPTNAIPIRIELRNFSRQFDARGLIHHFLDSNSLSHISIEFMMHLIKTGRIILLLDGYDEMAQFLNTRERRACLSALAELASDGANGILTSRPNYFTESEELSVFEALYATIEQSRYHLSRVDQSFIAEEKAIDEMVEKYVLNRYERSLQDLTPEQTESLVRRSLSNDTQGQDIVLAILRKVFRADADGSNQALSGKPVIITYLLELIEELRSPDGDVDLASLTEWQVYKLIVDRLMFRDLRRSSLNPEHRRRALQKLAIVLSGRDAAVANESVFQSVIDEEFRSELRRMQPEDRRVRKEELFEDLRSSATLTRAQSGIADGWIFSHNSLREYLATEIYMDTLFERAPLSIKIPVTAAMRSFVASVSSEQSGALLEALAELWPLRASTYALGPYLTLLWDAARKRQEGLRSALQAVSGDRSGEIIHINDITLKGIDISRDFKGSSLRLNASGSELSEISLDGIDLGDSKFEGAVLDSVSFRECNLSGTTFVGALMFDCVLVDARVEGANFTGLDSDSNIIIKSSTGDVSILSGRAAVGYLRYYGAKTNDIEEYYIYRNHPRFSIVEKICERVSEQRNTQLRGLTQRGEARIDPPFARQLVDRLVSAGWLQIDRNSLVSVTPAGRNVLPQIVSRRALPDQIVQFLASWR